MHLLKYCNIEFLELEELFKHDYVNLERWEWKKA